MIIGTAGHIDHGKTTLVKALTGVDTDRLPEEKRRGITLELGFAPIDLDGVHASVIDVPGHEAFVKTMVAGAAGIDVGLLVVAADEGIMPQTREHLTILGLLEIPALVVAITKSDTADAEWLSLVREEMGALIADSPWPSAPVIPCSAVSGTGLDVLRSALAASVPQRERGSADDLFRLPVDRCFTLKGTGTVVTGTVWSGALNSDATVRILPAGLPARVRRLHRHGREVAQIVPGDRAAIALAGVEVSDVQRGFALVTENSWEATEVLDAEVVLLESEAARLAARSTVRFHLAGAEVGASVIFSGEAKNVPAGRFARIKLDAPVAARGGDRFVLRLPAPVGTIGGGFVLDPFPGRRSLTRAARSFDVAGRADAATRFASLLAGAPRDGLAEGSLSVRLGVSKNSAAAIVRNSGCALAEGRCYPAAALGAAAESILTALCLAETTFPLERGVQLQSLADSAECDQPLARLAIVNLQKAGAVNVDGAVICRAGWKPALSAAHGRTAASLVHAICSAGGEPPAVSDLAAKYGDEVPGLLRYLEREGRIVQIGSDRYYAREAVDSLVAQLRKELEPGAEYGPSQLRDTLGVSRKYLIPFLEYCDRAGVTERKGDVRTLRMGRESLTQM